MEENKNVTRSFALTNFALRNKTSVIILTLLLTFAGLYSYIKIPKEAFPEVIIPTIYVGTIYPGNSPVDIENLVTRPLEKQFKTLTGVNKVTSTSAQDHSTILIEFKADIDIPKALQDVRDAAARAKKDLPNDLDSDPTVMEINLSEFPIMMINVSGDYDLEQLRYFAEYLQDEIEKLGEISSANLAGTLEREITININAFRMDAMQVSFSDIENAVMSENLSMSAGDVLVDNFRRAMRISGEFTSPSELNDIIVKKESDRTVYLRDVAQVIDGFEERKSFARADGFPVITVQVVKRSGENLIIAAEKINGIISKASDEKFPADLQITITNDLSKNTKMQVENLENSIISGVILVILILLFFMGVRNALFVGMAIPLSMFTAFFILFITGVTLNMIVLFALILALGMLVDNGIVVIENIYRLKQEGKTGWQAAKAGTAEVAMPIIASTATTLAAFVPLAFWTGIIGEFMKYLPITLIIVLSSSLFVALVINPVFTSIFMKAEVVAKNKNSRGLFIIVAVMVIIAVICYIVSLNLLGGLLIVAAMLSLLNRYALVPSSIWFQKKLIPKIEKFYTGQLRFALTGIKPFLYVGGTLVFLLVAIAFFFMTKPKFHLFPPNDPQYINVFVNLPVGTDIYYTDSITRLVEEQVRNSLQNDMHVVEAILGNVGKGVTDGMSFGDNSSPNKGRVTVSFVEYQDRQGVSTSEVMERVRADLQGLPGVEIIVEKNQQGPPVGKPVNIEISGEDFFTLVEISENLIQKINAANITGIEELRMDLETQKPQMEVHLNREKVRRYGLSTHRVASDLRTSVFGKEISRFKIGEDDYPIFMKLDDDHRYKVANLLNQRITFRDQATGKVQQIPVSSFADIDYTSTYGSIARINMNRVVTVYSNVREGANSNEIVGNLKLLLQDEELPDGYSITFTGEQEKQDESSEFLLQAMMIAVFAIFLILVSQFNSVLKPFIIVASVLFSTIGVFLGLGIFNMDFVIIMTGIGIISLAGIVVNNAIVLIDYTDLVRARRVEESGGNKLNDTDFIEAVVQGGQTRLRPVLLTAITTILGLIPLATGMNINYYTLLTSFNPQIYFGGENAAFWGPMAWTVIFGLTFATFLTLIIVPAMYIINHKIGMILDKIN